MAFLKNFFRKLKSSKRQKGDRLLTALGDEQDWNKEKKELVKYVSSLEGQLSKIQADKRKKPIEEKNILDEIGLVKELKQKADIIKKKKYDGLYSINNLYSKLSKDKKFKVELTDKDDSVTFDYFKSFVVLPNGNIGIQGTSGEVWAEGKTLSHIIWKPETIGNQIRRKRIQLAYDKDFQFIPDLEKLMMYEIKYEEDDGEFYESEEVMRPFKEMIIEVKKENNKLLEDKEYLEKTNELLNKTNQRIEKDLKVLRQMAEIGNSESSSAIKTALDSLKAIGKMSRENIILQDNELIANQLNDNKEEIINKLSETLEDEKSKTSDQKARDVYERLILFVKNNLGDTTIINPDKPETEISPTKPGQQLQ